MLYEYIPFCGLYAFHRQDLLQGDHLHEEERALLGEQHQHHQHLAQQRQEQDEGVGEQEREAVQ